MAHPMRAFLAVALCTQFKELTAEDAEDAEKRRSEIERSEIGDWDSTSPPLCVLCVLCGETLGFPGRGGVARIAGTSRPIAPSVVGLLAQRFDNPCADAHISLAA